MHYLSDLTLSVSRFKSIRKTLDTPFRKTLSGESEQENQYSCSRYTGKMWVTQEKKEKRYNENSRQKHTAASIRWSSPTQLLISRSEAYLWLSGREAEFSTVCGRM